MTIRRSARRWGLVAAASVLLLGVGTPVGSAASNTAPLQVLAKWRPFPSATNLGHTAIAIDSDAHVAYTLSQGNAQSSPIQVRAWKLDGLRAVTGLSTLATGTILSPATPVLAETRTRSLILAGTAAPGQAPTLAVSRFQGSTMAAAHQLATRFPPGYGVVGMAVNPARTLLYLLAQPAACASSVCALQPVGAGVGGIQVDALSLADLGRGTVTSPWTTPAHVDQACGQVLATTFPAGMVVSPDGHRVFFGCLSNRAVLTPLGPNATDVSGVAELSITVSSGAPTATLLMHPLAGSFGSGDTIAVPGQSRLLLTAPTPAGTSIKVFDTAHGYYVGNVGVDANNLSGIGVDDRTGQGYYLSGTGITAVDFAALPVPQGVSFPQLAPILGTLTRRMMVDSTTSRVFAPTSDDLTQGTGPYVAVLQGQPGGNDDSTNYVPPTGIDAPETAGLTDSARVGVAGAIGSEQRLVGGTANLLQNLTHFDSRGIVTRPGTRDLQLGVVSGLQLGNDQASAQAVTEQQDDSTTSDTTVAAPATPSQCVDFGGGSPKQSADGQSVTCDLSQQLVTGTATAAPGRILLNSPSVNGGKTVPDAVQVKSATATAMSNRNDLGPLSTRVTSEADGIDILGLVQIGKVTATAVVGAHGRRGSATASYSRAVSGVVVQGTRICDDTCPLSTVTAAINDALRGRAEIAFPQPDVFASPDGRVAWVQDNPYHHVEQVLFDDVSADTNVTPGMTITVYSDEATPSREIVSLAALNAQNVYRIYALGSPLDPHSGTPAGVTSGAHGGGSTGNVALPNGGSSLAPYERTQAPQTAPGNPLGSLLSNALHLGLRSPGQILGIAVIWMLLAVPAYLAARRRLLNDLPHLSMEDTP